MEFYSLTEPGETRPFGLLAIDGGQASRWLPKQQVWTAAPADWSYLFGGEPGAKQISEKEAEALKPSVRQLDDAGIRALMAPLSGDD